ncbi:hypothetical protein FOWG_18190 [Fusarium oxysporum f. sp. lycopersici MN25]|nr:hypothetical protein FOWG_18190 [Fusarium oxysporum f. sp. lycopersici MN25]
MAPSSIMHSGAKRGSMSHCGISAIGWASVGGLTKTSIAVRRAALL